MATYHTANYELCQWEPTDQVQRTDFNADNAKIDAALSALESGKVSTASLNSAVSRISALEANCATKSELETLEEQVEEVDSAVEALVKISIGTYTGDGTESRVINLGFKPKAVLVVAASGATMYYSSYNHHFGGLALDGYPAKTRNSGQDTITVVSNGFQVYDLSISTGASRDLIETNTENIVYRYVAFF